MGRIDVHAHLLPGVDDGSRTVDESIAMARMMVEAGYTHLFCTPHVWPTLGNTVGSIAPRVAELQSALDAAGVPLKLMPGGEMNISTSFCQITPDELVTYNNKRKYLIFDFWANELPPFFDACVDHIRSAGLQPILAHPERINALQNDQSLVDRIQEAGLLLQCNLECLGDETMTPRRELGERWLKEGRYFMLGSDLHRIETLDRRLRGLQNAIQLVGEAEVDRLTIQNPSKLL